MYVILTSKPGEFRAEFVDGLRPVASYDFLFFGRCRARFVIAELLTDVKLRVIDETPPETLNLVPSKFLEKFQTVEAARAELRQLVREGDAEVQLIPT